ncbi:MAG: hypothetical protein WCD79_22270 [Chthoniobacteraceae bacterium]
MQMRFKLGLYSWVLFFLLSLVPRGCNASSSTTPSNTAAPSAPGGAQPSGGGSLIAESKSAVYGALANGMNEMAAELTNAEPDSKFVFNLPVTAQDAANVAIITSSLNALITSVTNADNTLTATGPHTLRDDMKTLQRDIKNLKPASPLHPDISPPGAAPSATPSPSSGVGEGVLNAVNAIGSAFTSANAIAGVVTAVIGEAAQFKNTATNSSGSITLDTPTVNSLLTVALKKQGATVYDYTKLIPSAFNKNAVLNEFTTFTNLVVKFNGDVQDYQVQVDNLNQALQNATKAAGDTANQQTVNEANDLLAQLQKIKTLSLTLNTQYQAQLNSFLGLSSSNTGNPNGPASPSAVTPPASALGVTLAPSPVINGGPIAQYVLAAQYLQEIGHTPIVSDSKSAKDSKDGKEVKNDIIFITCRLVSADATETTVNRYLLENYTTSSAITTIEVDAFDLDGECQFAATIENRGANLYWFSRIKDSAQMSPSIVNEFPWIFRHPRQPQFTITRETSSTPNLKQQTFGSYSRYINPFSPDDLFGKILAVVSSMPGQSSNSWTVAKKLDQPQRAVVECVKNHPECFKSRYLGPWMWFSVRNPQ